MHSTDIKSQFPILSRQINGRSLVYLDTAATSQKPEVVLKAMDDFYTNTNANIHRGVHVLAEEATSAYEAAREKVATFIGASSASEIVFTKNATEAINLVAYSWGMENLESGDEIVLSEMEHHANIVPWQMVAGMSGAKIRFVPVNDDGQLDYDAFSRRLNDRTKMIAITGMSNVLGTVNDIRKIDSLRKKHAPAAKLLIDGSQLVVHTPVNVLDLKCDFFVFSGHKMYGPTGIGVLWGKKRILDAMPPFLGGGDMIKTVTLTGFTPNDTPYKFEAGTPPIAEVIGLAAAIDFLSTLNRADVLIHEKELAAYAIEQLSKNSHIKVMIAPEGTIVSFVHSEVHAHDLAQILSDHMGVCVRAGHHCAMILHDKLNVPATVRASFALYNTREDVMALVAGISKAEEVFGV
ncbi:MAG: SufS family cysteine desulfurase [Patescibacteria group bacterium]